MVVDQQQHPPPDSSEDNDGGIAANDKVFQGGFMMDGDGNIGKSNADVDRAGSEQNKAAHDVSKGGNDGLDGMNGDVQHGELQHRGEDSANDVDSDGSSSHGDIGLALSHSPSPPLMYDDTEIAIATGVSTAADINSALEGSNRATLAVNVEAAGQEGAKLVGADSKEYGEGRRDDEDAGEVVQNNQYDEDDASTAGTADTGICLVLSEVESNEQLDDEDEEGGDEEEKELKSGAIGTEMSSETEGAATEAGADTRAAADEGTNEQKADSAEGTGDNDEDGRPQQQQQEQQQDQSVSADADDNSEGEAAQPAQTESTAEQHPPPPTTQQAVNYPTALQKTLQLMAQQTDINTTDYTPSSSVDMRYRGPNAAAPHRMPGLSSLPAMFTESQPALFELGQSPGNAGGMSGTAAGDKRGSMVGRGRLNSSGRSLRASPTGGEGGSDSGGSGIILEETDEEEYDEDGDGSRQTASMDANEGRLEARIEDLEKMVSRLTELLLQKEQQASSPINGENSITATPARQQQDAAAAALTPNTPAAPDLSHSNVLPLDSPSPPPRRRTVRTQTPHGGGRKIPSPPRLDKASGGTADGASASAEKDKNEAGAPDAATPMQQATPDLEYRSYSQEHVDALRKRREAVAQRSYSFDVAEQLEREMTMAVVRAASPTAMVMKSNKKPTLPTVPPIPAVCEGEFVKITTVSEGVDAQRPPLAPRLDSARQKQQQQPSTEKGSPEPMPKLSSDESSTKSEKKAKKKESSSGKPPSRTNSSNSLSSKGQIRSSSITSSSDATIVTGSGSTPSKAKKSSSKPKSSVPSSSTKAAPLKHMVSSGVLGKEASATKPLRSPELPGRQTVLSYMKKEMMIDSKRQEGSAADDVDANMEEFLRVPSKLEGLLFFGFWICTDAFLYVLTFLPIKFVWSCICLAASIIRPKKGFGVCSFHRRHLYQILQMFVVLAVYHYVLMPISIGVLYHWIRGQAMLKLYVLIAIVEVFDRLLCSIGQDALDSLYWNCTRRPYHPRMIVSSIVVLIYATLHSLLLFLHVATLNVAMNSSDQALLTLIISGNFAEIKSTVFKKYNKQNLFKITTSDICERFKLALFLVLILILNCFQGGMSMAKIMDYMRTCGIVLVAEICADWIKHSFITKFNFIKSSTYPDYALILAGDLTGIGHEGINLNHTHAVVKRLGFSQIPVVCVMLRFLSEAMRYAIVFSHGDTEYFFNTFAFLYSEGRWATLGGLVFGVFLLTLVSKIVIGYALLGAARRMLEGPAVARRQSKM